MAFFYLTTSTTPDKIRLLRIEHLRTVPAAFKDNRDTHNARKAMKMIVVAALFIHLFFPIFLEPYGSLSGSFVYSASYGSIFSAKGPEKKSSGHFEHITVLTQFS
jgi:hypothetical protein